MASGAFHTINLAVFAWLGLWAVMAILRLARGHQHAIYVLLIVHFVLAGVPLLLDSLIGQPEYSRFPGFLIATRSERVLIAYAAYVSYVPVFWWLLGKPGSAAAINSNLVDDPALLSFLRSARPALIAVAISPLLLWLLAPQPELYLSYAPFARGNSPSLAVQQFHNLLAFVTILSLLSILGILASAQHLSLATLLVWLPWLLLAFWLNGKRFLVLIAGVSIWYILWHRGLLRGWRFFASALVGLLLVGIFSAVYQSEVRLLTLEQVGFNVLYENFRIDFGRESRIMMTLYAELYPSTMRILEHRGQSVLFTAAMYVPRALWPDKPLTYAEYFTSALFLVTPRSWGWGMTTSWLEEAISNFGWLGLILGPLFPALVCRVGDSTRNGFTRSLTVLVSALLLSMHLPAFMPLFLTWLGAVIWEAWVRRLARTQQLSLERPRQLP